CKLITMELVTSLKIATIFLLLGLSAIFSGSETAFFSLSRYQILKLKESHQGRLVASLLECPARLLISILVGNETVNIIASALATSVVISLYGERGKWITVAIMTPLLLLCGEVVPKAIAFVRTTSFCLKTAPFIALFVRIITPIRGIIRIVINVVLAPFPAPYEAKTSFFDDRFFQLLEYGHEKGDLKAIEKEFIINFIRFREKTVSEIMVPRPDILAFSLRTEIETVKSLLRVNRFSRIPIYENNLDNIIGILPTKMLLENKKAARIADLKDKLLPPYFVPLTKKADDLLWELQKQRVNMAIVVNEYGAVAGLITIEDLLEELFGEIYDEYDIPQRWYQQVGPNRYRVLAQMSLSDFNYIFKTNLKSEEDTLGGIILSTLGYLPQKGEVVQIGEFKFTITNIKGKRIIEVEVEKIKQ
ncbi:MAG: HlyC/CorC family transporter, partial [Candidatus Desulfofervidaceae bacterium]|nr:HlyC/CorC family transporter [Candidatus Desulfofervidaceae bacterium]